MQCTENRKSKDTGNSLRSFDFLTFNKELTLSRGSGRYVIAFDPSYVNKSGKHTPGVGNHWSGVANRAKWGLEIGGIADIDIDNHTAFHLQAIQTLNTDDKNLTDWYSVLISERADTLTSISRILVADAWFSKKPFADQLTEAGMHLISRLRGDADIKYLNREPPTDKRGRPSKYSGKTYQNKTEEHFLCQILKH